MSSTNTKCAGCNNKIINRLFMNCSFCQLKYDLDCANISEKRFNLLDKERKTTWKCEACRNRQPKGDNQNTPIRTNEAYTKTVHYEDFADSAVEEASEQQNVTVRPRTKLQIKSHNKPDAITAITPASLENISALLDKKLSTESPLICNLRSVLREDIKTMIAQELSTTINELKADFTVTTDFLTAEQVDLKMQVGQKDKEIKDLHSKTLKLQKEIDVINGRLSTIEKLSRDKNLEIQGVPENRNENLLCLFKTLCNTINAPMAELDIRNCRRVAKMDQTSKRPRSIIVTLASSRLRDDILAAVSHFNRNSKEKLNSKQLGMDGAINKIYVAEHLSPDGKKIFREARKVGKEKGYKFVWVRRGQVYARQNEDTPPILIKTTACLHKL